MTHCQQFREILVKISSQTVSNVSYHSSTSSLSSITDSPSSDSGAVSVPHTPERSQQRNLLGPASSTARTGAEVLHDSTVIKTLHNLVLVDAGELGHAAAPLDWQRVHRLQSTRVHGTWSRVTHVPESLLHVTALRLHCSSVTEQLRLSSWHQHIWADHTDSHSSTGHLTLTLHSSTQCVPVWLHKVGHTVFSSLYLDYDDECAGWVSVDAGAGKVSSGDGHQCCECSQLQQHQQWPVISLSTALIIMIQCQLQHSGYWPSWSWELLSSSSPSLSWYQSTTSVSALLENYFSQVSTPLSTWCVPPPPLSIIHSSLPVSTHWRCPPAMQCLSLCVVSAWGRWC